MAPKELSLRTCSEVISEFSTHLERRILGGSMSPLTGKTYLKDAATFTRLVGENKVLDEVDSSEIDDVLLQYGCEPDARFTNSEHDKGTGGVLRLRRSLGALFAFALREGFIQGNPMEGSVVSPRPTRAQGARSALGLDAARALTASAQTPFGAHRGGQRAQGLAVRNTVLLCILLETGLRVGELCALEVADAHVVDSQPWLLVRKGKGGKPRSVPLTTGTYTRIMGWVAGPRAILGAAGGSNALLLTVNGNPIAPRDVQNVCSRAASELPPALRRKVTPHGLRHTMATLALSEGNADIAVISRLLGHSSLAVTGLYLDEVRGELVRAVNSNAITGDG